MRRKTKILSQEEANKLLSDTLEEAKKKLLRCEEIAREYRLEFDSPLSYVYGMGGRFELGRWISSTQDCM